MFSQYDEDEDEYEFGFEVLVDEGGAPPPAGWVNESAVVWTNESAAPWTET